MMKMSSKSETIKPKTDFELVLNYSNQGIWKDDSGAGANAACRIDKTFSATDPLSEIVWSPDKDKPTDDVFVEPIAVICSKSDVSSTDTPARHPTSQVDERPVSNLLLQADEPKCNMEENPSPSKHCNGNIDTGIVNQRMIYKLSTMRLLEQQQAQFLFQNSVRIIKKIQVNEKMLLCSKNHPVMPSPSNSRIQMTRNEGKAKSLSDEDSNVSLSKEEEGHLSVECFHSAGLFLAGREAGCSQSIQDEDKSLALNLENPNHHLQQPDQKLLTCNKNQDPELKNVGFRSNVQSMVGAKFKNVGTIMSQVGEASKDFEPGTKENENCYNLELTKEKEGMALLSLHSTSTRQNTNDKENVESYALYERKEICHRSDNVEGLWINRFLPKSTSPLVVFDHLNERGGSEVHSASCAMLPHSHKHISLKSCKIEEAREQSTDDQLLAEAQNLHNCGINKEDSTVLKDDKGNQYHTAKLHKFNSFTPFPGFRDSGPMVSMFARRLGAIKQFQHTE
ncbi:hypothetical protein D0Y65_054703 [Glycine soja]|uniref:Uncharacterized protein n=1 Tax=Glycine soja TaxID=3848 RepID=A0A445F7Z3_GLYSO|nr:hypothetical protein D0Y65_054703 [Glycine soja]